MKNNIKLSSNKKNTLNNKIFYYNIIILYSHIIHRQTTNKTTINNKLIGAAIEKRLMLKHWPFIYYFILKDLFNEHIWYMKFNLF